MRRFVLQMAGESGSGKSTLARAIGEATGAVVIDRDLIKAPLLAHLPDEQAGGWSYDVFYSLADSLADQGFSLVLDSAAFYARILTRGHELAERLVADYSIIECVCDEEEQAERLESRPRLASQPSAMAEIVLQRMLPGRVALQEPHLIIETSRPLDVCLAEALEYLGRDAG